MIILILLFIFFLLLGVKKIIKMYKEEREIQQFLKYQKELKKDADIIYDRKD